MARRALRHPPSAVAETGPSAERRAHGAVEQLDRPIADDSGHAASPYRAVDILALMERRGAITSAMRQAGDDFRARFAVAQLDPLRALDYSRPRDGSAAASRRRGEEPGSRAEGARDRVWRAILAVGGIGSPAGSCLWHVVGWERSLKEWALEQGWSGRRVSQEAASGILIAALGALAGHYRHPVELRVTHFAIDKSGSIAYNTATLAKPGSSAGGDGPGSATAPRLSSPPARI
ncbi:MAG: DUF6456 domain-containing protein [Stellaceae bacterium]